MQATRLIVIRHGETDWNAIGRIQGLTDIALNARGLRQAERLAHALSHESIDAIYASDLSRAMQTAQPLAAAAGLAVQPDAGLRERGFGVFEGMTFPAIETNWPDQARRWRARDASFGPEGGERLGDFFERCVSVARALGERHLGQTVALVAHGGVLDCLYRAATRIALDAPRTWRLANASINRLLHTPDGLTLVGWADTHHLDADDAMRDSIVMLNPAAPPEEPPPLAT